MNYERKRLLARIAYQYYKEDKTQNEIAKRMNVNRTTVSRMIQQAKDEGLVEVRIKQFEPQLFSLENYMKEKYGLKDILIVPNNDVNSKEEEEEKFHREAAYYLKRTVANDMSVGVSWGETLGKTIAQLENQKQTNANFVPLAGGPSHINSEYHVNTLVYELAQKFKGKSIFINASVIQETKEIAKGILSSKYFEKILDLWQKLDVAIVGIGGTLNEKDSRWRDLLSEEDIKELKLREAVGDCVCRFYDFGGKILKTDLYDRTISIKLENLKEVPISIGVAYSKEKARSILPTIKKGFINTLISDEETVLHMLRIEKDPKYEVYSQSA